MRRTLVALAATIAGLTAGTAALAAGTTALAAAGPAAAPAAAPAVAAAAAAGPAAAAPPVRIMPLGDSITGSPGCWRALLWQQLQQGGLTNVDMVGTQPPQGCSVSHDGDHEGHGGALVTAVADAGQLPGWLAATRPDVVLMHFGTNDVWSNKPIATILAAFSTLVDQMRASNPAMKILVAQIIPMNPGTCPECAQRVVALDAAIPGWAASRTTAASPITVVDQWTGFTPATDTGDGVHPNASGDRKMADRWYPALSAALSGTVPPTPTPPTSTPPTSPTSPTTSPTSPTASPTASPTPTGGARCSATYSVSNSWSGGFQGQVVITNTGTVPVTAWTIAWTPPAGEAVTQVWGGTATLGGASVTVAGPQWSARIPVGGTATVGFLGSSSGSPAVPVVTCTAT